MKSAVTVSLVQEAEGGPFVFWHDLPFACREASRLGFDAIELFAPGPDTVKPSELRTLLSDHKLNLAAVGTGAGWLKHKLTLTHANATIRRQAIDFVKAMIEFAAENRAPVIIGSMQGRWGDGVSHETALGYLNDALVELGEFAMTLKTDVIYEPLNRYETNLARTLDEGHAIVTKTDHMHVSLLADLFHMNIEEVNLGEALTRASEVIMHIHLADSNRRPAGSGHIDFGPIATRLRAMNYRGYLSAEAYAYPNSVEAATATMTAFRKYFAKP
jgi:sugar phosphate isomerase/epimerase